MPTNEERREIAARLRRINGISWTHIREELEAIDAAIGTAYGMPHALQTIRERLADLIEPEERTCTFSECWGDDSLPTCSACDWEAEEEDCVVCSWETEEDGVFISGLKIKYDGKFCKECGARVVCE